MMYDKVVVKKMTRNGRKMIGKTADSLLCCLHSIQFSTLVFLPLCTLDAFSQIISLESNFFEITGPKGKSNASKSYAIVNTLDWKKSRESSRVMKKFEEIRHTF